jgi:hypothetical protein
MSAFVLAEGCSVPDPFNDNNHCLVSLSKLSWLSFYPENTTFAVFTKDKQYEGNYTVFVV